MGYLFGIAAVILLYSISTKQSAGDSASKADAGAAMGPPGKPLPDFVRKAIEDAQATKEDLQKASELAAEAGFPKLQLALAARANGAKQLIPCPWKDVTSSEWTRFCSVIANGHKAGDVNPKGFFGIFQIGVRRLVDLGVMSNPITRNVNDDNGQSSRIWQGTWCKTSEKKFLNDPQEQYRLFVKSMELYRGIISEKYTKVLNLDIDGKPATLSGLLALSHTAGSEGMYKWLTQGEIRNKFAWVTQAYHKANGIF